MHDFWIYFIVYMVIHIVCVMFFKLLSQIRESNACFLHPCSPDSHGHCRDYSCRQRNKCYISPFMRKKTNKKADRLQQSALCQKLSEVGHSYEEVEREKNVNVNISVASTINVLLFSIAVRSIRPGKLK